MKKSKNSICKHFTFIVIQLGSRYVARCLVCWKRGKYAWSRDAAIDYFVNGKSMLIKIIEPWWGAWKRFGWKKQTWGVGINKSDVESAIRMDEDLDLFVWKFKTKYRVDPRKVKEFAESTGAKFRAKFDTLLYVVPQTMLAEVDT